jgi:hypothetical protein
MRQKEKPRPQAGVRQSEKFPAVCRVFFPFFSFIPYPAYFPAVPPALPFFYPSLTVTPGYVFLYLSARIGYKTVI